MSRKERERLAVLAQVKRGKLSYRPVQLSQCEGIGADGDGFAGAEARHADADALQGVVLHLRLAAGHGDGARLTSEEDVQLRRVFEIEGDRGQPAKLLALGAGGGAI